MAAREARESRWQRLRSVWRASEGITPSSDEGFGSGLVGVLLLIEEERLQWAGTRRTVCTESELEDRYRMRDVLGSGAFGIVYRAIRTADAEELAVKVIEHTGSVTERAKAVNECALWQAISSPFHPAILPLLEVVEVLGTESLYLVTPQMVWGNLAEALQDPEVDRSEQAARLMTIQLVSAVAHLHLVHKIAHRDIKPGNVLCEGPEPSMIGCLKLCDFGCCQRFEYPTKPIVDTPIGTVNYAAPELAAAFLAQGPAAWAAPPTDCWALGVIAYQIIAGAPPFAHRDYGDSDAKLAVIASPMACDQVPYPSASFGRLSEAGGSFLRRLLAFLPRERADVHEALGHEWLQPVHDKALRERMAEAAPSEAAPATGKQRLQAAGRRLMLANRLMRIQLTGKVVQDNEPHSPSSGWAHTQDERPSSIAASFKRAHASREVSTAGSFKGNLIGSFKGTSHGSFKGSPSGSFKGSIRVQLQGSFNATSTGRSAGLPLGVTMPSQLAAAGEGVEVEVDPILYYVAAHSMGRRQGHAHPAAESLALRSTAPPLATRQSHSPVLDAASLLEA